MSESERISNDYWHFINTHPNCSPDEAMYYAQSKENSRWCMSTPPYEGSSDRHHPDLYLKKGDRIF